MKLEIEVPDGFLCGKLVFIEERPNGLFFDDIIVDTERMIEAKKIDTTPKREKRLVPWEAD